MTKARTSFASFPLPGKTTAILPIYRSFSPSFSPDGTPSAIFPPTCSQILPISAYFRLIWYPILVINSRTAILGGISPIFRRWYPICHFSAYVPLIFRRSCLPGLDFLRFHRLTSSLITKLPPHLPPNYLITYHQT